MGAQGAAGLQNIKAPDPAAETADEPMADGLSLDGALQYYQSRNSQEQVQIQIGGLVVLWMLGFLSFGFAGLIGILRGFTFYLEMQALAEGGEQDKMAEALQSAQATAGMHVKDGEQAAAHDDAPADGEVLLRKTKKKVQRSAAPGARSAALAKPDIADIGIDLCPVTNGLKIAGLKPGTSAADSDFMVGDIVTIIDDQFTAGIEAKEIVACVCGPCKSSVEITAKRFKQGGFSEKIVDTVERDAPPRSQEEWLIMWKSVANSSSGFSLAALFFAIGECRQECSCRCNGQETC